MCTRKQAEMLRRFVAEEKMVWEEEVDMEMKAKGESKKANLMYPMRF